MNWPQGVAPSHLHSSPSQVKIACLPPQQLKVNLHFHTLLLRLKDQKHDTSKQRADVSQASM